MYLLAFLKKTPSLEGVEEGGNRPYLTPGGLRRDTGRPMPVPPPFRLAGAPLLSKALISRALVVT